MEKSKWAAAAAAAISGAWHLIYLSVYLLYCGERRWVVATEQTGDWMSAGIIFTLGDGLLKLEALLGSTKRRSSD